MSNFSLIKYLHLFPIVPFASLSLSLFCLLCNFFLCLFPFITPTTSLFLHAITYRAINRRFYTNCVLKQQQGTFFLFIYKKGKRQQCSIHLWSPSYLTSNESSLTKSRSSRYLLLLTYVVSANRYRHLTCFFGLWECCNYNIFFLVSVFLSQVGVLYLPFGYFSYDVLPIAVCFCCWQWCTCMRW